MKKTLTSNNIPEKSTLNDIEREPSTYENMNKVDLYEQEDNYVPAKKRYPALREGIRTLRCEHFSGLLEAGIEYDEFGRAHEVGPRYKFTFVDAENMTDRCYFTLKADDATAVKNWKRNVNRRYNGECYNEFNKTVSRDAAAPVDKFKVGAFARYMREHDLVIRYEATAWVDKEGNYIEPKNPYLHWYEPDKDRAERKWVF